MTNLGQDSRYQQVTTNKNDTSQRQSVHSDFSPTGTAKPSHRSSLQVMSKDTYRNLFAKNSQKATSHVFFNQNFVFYL